MKHQNIVILNFIILSGLLCSNFCFARIFVNISALGNNNGTSWENAYTSLQAALNRAGIGEQIWVATGTYLPANRGDPKTTTFHVSQGIKLYGGFSGMETSLNERTPSRHITTLSGDLNQDDIPNDFSTNRDDNVSNVMLVETLPGVIPLIDGFTFKGGQSDGGKIEEKPGSSGAALFLYGAAIVRNCSFIQNYSSHRGGALSLIDSLGQESNGGAISVFMGSASTNSKFYANNCSFKDNSTNTGENGIGEYGGAIHVVTLGTAALTTIINSRFSNNNSKGCGGAIGIIAGKSGTNNRLEIKNCQLENNTSDDGGGLFFMSLGLRDSLFVEQCSFTENSVYELHPNYVTRGGAMHLDYNFSSRSGRSWVKNCVFDKNSCAGSGGGARRFHPLDKKIFPAFISLLL